ncbi:Uncharacterised protein [uncultured archaeon]|nr:Uncharacterised protein [uncultured archaeon]
MGSLERLKNQGIKIEDLIMPLIIVFGITVAGLGLISYFLKITHPQYFANAISIMAIGFSFIALGLPYFEKLVAKFSANSTESYNKLSEKLEEININIKALEKKADKFGKKKRRPKK